METLWLIALVLTLVGGIVLGSTCQDIYSDECRSWGRFGGIPLLAGLGLGTVLSFYQVYQRINSKFPFNSGLHASSLNK